MTRRHFVSIGSSASLAKVSASPSPAANPVTALALSPGGALYAASGNSVTKDGQTHFQPDWRCVSVAILSETHVLVTGGLPGRAGKVAIVSATPQEQTLGKDLVYGIAAHPDSNVAAAACHDGQVFELDLTSSALTLLGRHNGIARCVAYSPDGRFLAGTAHLSLLKPDGEFQIIIVDLTRTQGRVLYGTYFGCTVAFTRDSKFVVTGGFGAPEVWNAETGERVDSVR